VRFNNAVLETQVGEVDNYVYTADFTPKGSTKKIRYTLASGYKIPFYDQGTMQLYTSYVSIAGRNHVHDPNSSVAETNPVNTSPSTHTRVSSSRLSIDNIDSETTPPEPTVFLSSENPMTPWNSNGNGMSKAYDEITITATNTSDEYNTTIVINGIEYENGVKFDKLGTHNCMILYEDKYN